MSRGVISGTQLPREPPWVSSCPVLRAFSFTDDRLPSDLPESAGSEPPASTLRTSSTYSRTGSDSFPTTNSPNSSNSGGGGSHVGAIAGGVIGAFAAIGIIAALITWFVMKKKRSRVAPSSAFINKHPSRNPFHKFDKLPPPSPVHGTSQMTYHPGDPSPFPTPFHDPPANPSTVYPHTTYDPPVQKRGQYSGAPEV